VIKIRITLSDAAKTGEREDTVLSHRRQIVGLFGSGSWLRSQTGLVLSGLALAVTSGQGADAARKGERRADEEDHKNDDARNNQESSEESNRSETDSNQRDEGEASAKSRDSGTKSDNSEKQDQSERKNENDEGRAHKATDSGKSRGDSQRNSDADSDSNKSADDGDSHHHGGRHLRGFEQKAADEPTGDSPADNPPANDVPDSSSATPANPNVAIDDVPDTSPNDLLVQANDNVVASVSTSGGFAFARSGDVTAISGPDGASIVQNGTGTTGTTPTEPSGDGGNNNPDFAS
jgi:hypothetical protein